MQKITLDAAAIARLSELTTGTEICDGDGKVIGFYRPKLDPAKYGPLEPQISEEELERRLKSNKRHTVEQVLERLRQLRPGSI